MNHPYQDPRETYWTDGDPDVPVFQRPAEFERLLALYRERRPRRVLEVGTYYGGTLKQWLRRARKGAHVVSIDSYAYRRADNRAKYADWTPKGVKLTALAGHSQDPAVIAQARALGPYDWIFIDADHTYDAVKADWLRYGAMAATGGVIIFHDIVADPRRHPEIQVPQLWREIQLSRQYTTHEIVQAYHVPWGGLGLVFV